MTIIQAGTDSRLNNDGWSINIVSGFLKYKLFTTGAVEAIKSSLFSMPTDYKWMHLAYTYDLTNMRILVDGVEVAIEP